MHTNERTTPLFSKERLQRPKGLDLPRRGHAERGDLPLRKLRRQAQGRLLVHPEGLPAGRRPPVHPHQGLPAPRGGPQGHHPPPPPAPQLGGHRPDDDQRLAGRHQQVDRDVHPGGRTRARAESALFGDGSCCE